MTLHIKKQLEFQLFEISLTGAPVVVLKEQKVSSVNWKVAILFCSIWFYKPDNVCTNELNLVFRLILSDI